MERYKCPICGEPLTITAKKAACSNKACGFSFHTTVAPSLSLSREDVLSLLTKGQTEWIPFDEHGCNNPVRLFRSGFTVFKEHRFKFINGTCPVCGGAMMVTSKGYACYNATVGKKCTFRISGIMSHRKISIQEAEGFLLGKNAVIDGFTNDKGKIFSGILKMNNDKGMPYVDSVVATCPFCGGRVHAGQSFYACENFKNPDLKCTFKVYREISHHSVTVDELRQLCSQGQTDDKITFFKADGTIFRSRLAIDTNGCTIFT